MGVRKARQRLVAVVAFVVLVVAERGALAEDRAVWLELTRSKDADRCPDAEHVWQSVNALFPSKRVHASPDVQRSSQRVAIAVSRETSGYEAIFSVEGDPSAASRLVDPDPECRGLADALAVALILRLDPDHEREPKRAPEPSLPSRRETGPNRPSPSRLTWVALESGALLGTGLLGRYSQPSFGTQFGLALGRERVGLRARAFRLISSPTAVAGGSVHVDLWAASLGPCVRFAFSKRWALDPCLEFGLGRQHGVAQDFPVHREAHATWLGISPTLTLLARLSGPLRATLGAGGTALVRGQRYVVDGNVVSEQPPIGLFISLGLSLGWDFRSRE